MQQWSPVSSPAQSSPRMFFCQTVGFFSVCINRIHKKCDNSVKSTRTCKKREARVTVWQLPTPQPTATAKCIVTGSEFFAIMARITIHSYICFSNRNFNCSPRNQIYSRMQCSLSAQQLCGWTDPPLTLTRDCSCCCICFHQPLNCLRFTFLSVTVNWIVHFSSDSTMWPVETVLDSVIKWHMDPASTG